MRKLCVWGRWKARKTKEDARSTGSACLPWPHPGISHVPRIQVRLRSRVGFNAPAVLVWSLCWPWLYLSDCIWKHFCSTCADFLSCPGCSNKIPQTGWLMKKNKFMSRSHGGCRSEIRVPQGQVMVLFWVEDFCLYPHMAEGARELCGAFLLRTRIPFRRALASWPEHLPKALLPGAMTLGIRIPSCESGGTQTFTP